MAKHQERGTYGAGTFTQRGKKWSYRVWVTDPETNIPVRKTFTDTTKAKCREQAKAFEKGELEPPSRAAIKAKPTLREWAEKWLPIYKQGDVGHDTYIGYKSDLKHITKDKIANLKLDAVTPADVKDFLNRLSKQVSKSVLKTVRFLLNGMFEDAIDNNLCGRNPVRRVKLPAMDDPPPRQIFTDEQLMTMVEFCMLDEAFGAAMMLLLYSGMRCGELLAINIKRDLIGDVLHVRGSLTASGKIVGDSKTKKHVGAVPLPKIVVDMLLALDREAVCLNKLGSPMGVRTFHTAYKEFFDRLNAWCAEGERELVPFLTVHSTRHTYRSALNKLGVDDATARELMRQRDVSMDKRYTHVTEAQKKEAVVITFEEAQKRRSEMKKGAKGSKPQKQARK